MKRSGPLKRTKGLKRSSRPLQAQSAKRKAEASARREVVALVLERADGKCEHAPHIPEVPCGYYPPERPGLEVDELRGGSWRGTEYLDPASCRATCPRHHDIKTTNKNEILRRLRGEPHGILHL